MQRPVLEFFQDTITEPVYVSADYTSLVWENCAADAGKMEIRLPHIATEIQPGMIVRCQRGQREPYGVISYVSYDENGKSMVIMGNMLSQLLKYRYPDVARESFELYSPSGAGSLICTAATQGNTYSHNKFFEKNMVTEAETEDVLTSMEFRLTSSNFDTMKSIAEANGYGFYCTVEDGAFKAGAYKSKDNGGCMDADFGEISGIVYTISDDNLRNAFNYTITENGEMEYFQGHCEETGVGRRELYLGNYEKIPSALIREKKEDFALVKTISGTVHIPYIERFNVGEIVTVIKRDWGLSERLVITSVTEIWEDDYKCLVTFGKPQDTAYRKLIKILR